MGSSSLLEGTSSGLECEDTGARTDSGLGSGTLFSLKDKWLVERLVEWHLPAGAQMLPLLEISKQALLLEQLYEGKKKKFKSIFIM
jgi:hypothetical protein